MEQEPPRRRAAGTKPPVVFAKKVGKNLPGSKGGHCDIWKKIISVV